MTPNQPRPHDLPGAPSMNSAANIAMGPVDDDLPMRNGHSNGALTPGANARRAGAPHATTHALERGYETRPGVEKRLADAGGRILKRWAQAGLRLGLGALGAATRDWRDPLPPLHPGDARIRRILVVRVDLLGDVVLSIAAVRALRRAYPHAQIDMLVQRSSADILQGDPDIHRVITFDPQLWLPTHWRAALGFFWSVWRPRYDLAVSLCGDIGSIATRLTFARRRVGYAGEAYGGFMTDPIPGRRYDKPEHEIQYILTLAEAAGGIVASGDERPRLTVDPVARERMAAVIAEKRAASGAQGPLITLHAGARNGQAKRWPTRHCAALADRLRADLDALVILTGAPNEASLADAVTRQQRHSAVNLCGQTTTRELAALLALSDVVVSGDSGPMHIACAVGAPVVVLHGPTDPNQSGPTDPDAIILRRDLWCSPCYDPSATAECRFGNPVCMKEITPGMAFAAVRRQLGRYARLHAARDAQSQPTLLATVDEYGDEDSETASDAILE